MEETVTRVKVASAINAMQRRDLVRLRVAFRVAREKEERGWRVEGAGRGRSLAKVRRSAAVRRRKPPPR
jgi:hypothetical protein